MVDGFWLLQFEGMLGNGGGVVFFTKGKVFGGDSNTTYIGEYEEAGDTLSARVLVHNYMPGVVSIIGIEGDYDLEVKGAVDGDMISAAGNAVEHAVAGMALKLTKLANLP